VYCPHGYGNCRSGWSRIGVVIHPSVSIVQNRRIPKRQLRVSSASPRTVDLLLLNDGDETHTGHSRQIYDSLRSLPADCSPYAHSLECLAAGEGQRRLTYQRWKNLRWRRNKGRRAEESNYGSQAANSDWLRMPVNRCTNQYIICKRYSYRCNRPWRPIELWDVDAPTFSRQSAHWWR
jgi:hypothetical protein